MAGCGVGGEQERGAKISQPILMEGGGGGEVGGRFFLIHYSCNLFCVQKLHYMYYNCCWIITVTYRHF